MSTTAADAIVALPTSLPGFRRPNGAVGVRNHLLVLSTVALTNRLAELAAERARAALDEAPLVVATDFVRGLRGPDQALQNRVIEGLIRHPNVGACLALCHDASSAHALAMRLGDLGKPLAVQAFMTASGMEHAVARAAEAVAGLGRQLGSARREPLPWSALTVALECGGSDPTSSICANPVIGTFVDALVRAGGRAIVSETAEFIGAEPVVEQRAADPAVARAVLERIARVEACMAEDGDRYRGVNPTPENIAGGLTTLVEKSMGAVAKTGTTPIVGCLDFAEPPRQAGVYFMDTPFFSPISITGMVAAGAQMTLFGVGVFNPSGNPLAPTIKVCGNPKTVRTWSDAIDLDVSGLVRGETDLTAMGARLAALVAKVADGAVTKTESWGEGQVLAVRTLPLI